jgi:flagellar hook-length control protein FliK
VYEKTLNGQKAESEVSAVGDERSDGDDRRDPLAADAGETGGPSEIRMDEQHEAPSGKPPAKARRETEYAWLASLIADPPAVFIVRGPDGQTGSAAAAFASAAFAATESAAAGFALAESTAAAFAATESAATGFALAESMAAGSGWASMEARWSAVPAETLPQPAESPAQINVGMDPPFFMKAETTAMNPAPEAVAVAESLSEQDLLLWGEIQPADPDVSLTAAPERAAFQVLYADPAAETAPTGETMRPQIPDGPEQNRASVPAAADETAPQAPETMARQGAGDQTEADPILIADPPESAIPIREASLQGAVLRESPRQEIPAAQLRTETASIQSAQPDVLIQAAPDVSLSNQQDPDARQEDPEGEGAFKQAMAEGLPAKPESALFPEVKDPSKSLNSAVSDTNDAQVSHHPGLLLQLLNQPARQVFSGQNVDGRDPNAFAKEMPSVVLQSVQSFEGADGAKEVVIQLAPAELGHLTVRLVSQDGLLAIRILAHSPMTQRVLENGIAGLKQALDQQGIRYERIEVELDGYQMGHHQSGEEQASAWANRQNSGSYDQKRFRGSDLYETAEDRMSLTGEIPGETGGAREAEAAYGGQINYVV